MRSSYYDIVTQIQLGNKEIPIPVKKRTFILWEASLVLTNLIPDHKTIPRFPVFVVRKHFLHLSRYRKFLHRGTA